MSSPAEQLAAYDVHPTSWMAATAFLLGITTIALALRLYVRAFMLKAIGADDILLIVSQAFFIVFCGSIIAVTHTQREEGLFAPVLKLIKDILISEASYILCMLFAKFALAAFFLRIVHKNWHRYLIYSAVGVYGLYAFAPFFVNIFQCGKPDPINFLTPDKCPIGWNVSGPVNYLAAATNAVADWAMTIIPIAVIMHLQLPQRDKISALALVALGSAASIISVVRIPFMNSLKLTGDLHFFHRIEIIGWLSVWECGLAIVAISASAYRPLWHGVSINPADARRTRGSPFGSISGGHRSRSRPSRPGSRSRSMQRLAKPSVLESGLHYPRGNTTTVVTGTGTANQSSLMYNVIEKGEEIFVHSEKI